MLSFRWFFLSPDDSGCISLFRYRRSFARGTGFFALVLVGSNYLAWTGCHDRIISIFLTMCWSYWRIHHLVLLIISTHLPILMWTSHWISRPNPLHLYRLIFFRLYFHNLMMTILWIISFHGWWLFCTTLNIYSMQTVLWIATRLVYEVEYVFIGLRFGGWLLIGFGWWHHLITSILRHIVSLRHLSLAVLIIIALIFSILLD